MQGYIFSLGLALSLIINQNHPCMCEWLKGRALKSDGGRFRDRQSTDHKGMEVRRKRRAGVGGARRGRAEAAAAGIDEPASQQQQRERADAVLGPLRNAASQRLRKCFSFTTPARWYWLAPCDLPRGRLYLPLSQWNFTPGHPLAPRVSPCPPPYLAARAAPRPPRLISLGAQRQLMGF
jgi:hypothetical protein